MGRGRPSEEVEHTLAEFSGTLTTTGNLRNENRLQLVILNVTTVRRFGCYARCKSILLTVLGHGFHRFSRQHWQADMWIHIKRLYHRVLQADAGWSEIHDYCHGLPYEPFGMPDCRIT